MRLPPTHMLLTAALLFLAVGLRVADPEPVARLRLSVFDSYLRLAPRIPDPSAPVRVVDVDEASLARVGQWPWPRTALAKMIDNLAAAGAKTVSLDLILAEPDRLSPAEIARQIGDRPELAPLAGALEALASNDQILADAIAKTPVVVGLAAGGRSEGELPGAKARFAIAGDDPKLFVPRVAGAVSSLPVLAAAAAGEGVVNWLPAQDQIVRRVPLLANIADTLYPSLSVETLRVGGKESTLFVRSSGGSGVLSFGQRTGVDTVRVGTTVLPTDADGQMWLNFSRREPGRYIPAHTVLDGSFDRSAVAGRYILVGSSATGLLDLRATPLEASVPGVEVHAQALEQMLSGAHLVRPALATGAELVFLVVAGLAVAALIRRSGPIVAAVLGLAAIGAVVLASWLAFSRSGFLFDPVYPSLAVLALYVSGSLATYIRTETDRARVRSAFSHYVAAPLVDELARNHDKLKLGGEMREVTLLFADVRGFSKLSEGMDAEELIGFVNRLFTPLSEIILEKRGTIDKFMGDAVMAFWNAPVEDPNHAANACRAALAMIAELDRLNETWAAEARARGAPTSRVRIGIGLNTGAGCVGNVGSPQRFDYSILGDVVNIASRLEEATKIYGVPIIAGEATARKAQDLAFLEIGTAALRGKQRTERLFALVGDEGLAWSGRFRELSLAHGALIEAAASGDATAAEAALAACRKICWPEIAPLYEHYARALSAVPAP